jgi:HK97 family phage prohead protease
MREERTVPLTVEVRAADDGGGPIIAGHAAVFNSPSHDLGGFREYILPGAFKRTLKNSRDIPSFFNHDPHYVLGRTGNKTLTLAEDLEGLAFQVRPPETAWARDLLVSMRRGDISGASFTFRVIRDQWDKDTDGMPKRSISEIELYEAGPVSMPAYPAADANVRALFGMAGLDAEAIAAVLRRRSLGLDLTDEDRELIASQASAIQTILPPIEVPSDPVQADHSLDARRRRLALLALL